MIDQTFLPIPQADPRSNYLAHKKEIDTAIQRVLEGGHYILGKETTYFEKEFSEYLGVNHAIGVGNGTDALELSLKACGVQPGDTVITVSHTAVATVVAIERCGAVPVLVDIDPLSFTMDPGQLEATLDLLQRSPDFQLRPPSVVIPVHLYGQPADMPTICNIARRFNLIVIEDVAQSHGAESGGRKAGSWGDLAGFSFYPTKNLGAIGDGGMVVTDVDEFRDNIHLLRQYGWKQRYISDVSGGNSRLDELQSAILRMKLLFLDQENDRRTEIASLYDRTLSAKIQHPTCRSDTKHVYHQYVIRTPKRNELRDYLNLHSIGTGIHYPQPIHLQPAYRNSLVYPCGLPVTEKIVGEILSLPIYPQLRDEQVEFVVDRINQWSDSIL